MSNVNVFIQSCGFAVGTYYGIGVWNTSTLLIQSCDFQVNETNNAGIYIQNVETRW